MDILKELYYGRVSEISRLKDHKESPLRKREMELYDILQNKLSEEDKEVLNDFADVIGDSFNEDIEEAYVQGLKTGILMGIEVGKFDLD